MDNWLTATQASVLRAAADPLVVDLGYGATAVTTVELADRLRRVRPDVRVVGIEIDRERVTAAAGWADPPRLDFRHGGFEMGGLRPVIVRAANVLRQYEEAAAARAWRNMTAALADGGVLVEGTCDEIGRRSAWVLLDTDGPRTLTLAAKVDDLPRPGALAERLPKALIHRNVPGEPIHRFLGALDAAWDAAAPRSTFGPRQRWIAMCSAVAGEWPVDVRRARHAEITVAWDAVH